MKINNRVKIGLVAPVLFVSLLLSYGQAAAGNASSSGTEVAAYITGFDTADDGMLKISYSDETHVEIAKDKRGSYQDEEPINQKEVFSEIRVAADKQRIGWVPQYMICTQSWPCTPELVIFERGVKPKYIEPPFGIVWYWMFLKGRNRVVVHYGFTHGDAEGEFGLYDLASLKELATFTQHTNHGKEPAWVSQLEAIESSERE